MLAKNRASSVTLALVAVVTLFCGMRRTGASPSQDPKAVEVDQAMMQAMGGQDAWNSAHFVRFDFKVTVGGKMMVDNAHLWDRKDGRYRIEQMPKDGKREVVLFNIADYERDKQGSAYLDGKKLEGDEAKKSLEAGYASYINDTWWLAMPWKWTQPGVNLKYLGPRPCGQGKCDVVELTFGHVGLTPGDMYLAFVSQKSPPDDPLGVRASERPERLLGLAIHHRERRQAGQQSHQQRSQVDHQYGGRPNPGDSGRCLLYGPHTYA